MSRIFRRLKILTRTNLIVSNREATNAFLSYVGHAIAALFLLGIAIVPLIGAASKDTRPFPLIFILFVAMMDYFSIQSKLATTSLIDNSTLSLFPLSRIRSVALRFIVLLLDKRILFYLVPVLGVIIFLFGKASLVQLLIMVILFATLYFFVSELLFPIFILLRRLADRYSAKTVTQLAAIPFLIVFLLLSLLHPKGDFALQVPVVSQFAKAFWDVLTSDTGETLKQLSELVLITVAYSMASVTVSAFVPKLGVVQNLSRALQLSKRGAKEESPSDSAIPVGRGIRPAYSDHFSERGGAGTAGHSLRSCLLLDWRIRQKEERVVYTLVMYPALGVWAGLTMSHTSHRPGNSSIFLIFFIALMLGVAVTENHLTQRGLRLKHVSIFPLDERMFVLMKSLSVWLLISGIDLLTVVLIALWVRTGVYQELQGLIYSVYIPLVFLLSSTTLALYFNSISRHPLISLVLILAVGIIGTFIYVMLMLFNFFVGLTVVIGMFLLTYFLWIPSWGSKLSSEFQVLLEESK
ncbi:MAG: hypothetical protein M1339_01200 [Bacteroidetes bacterium]|nr:hypothetical protein [Bacteroidota bacterium]